MQDMSDIMTSKEAVMSRQRTILDDFANGFIPEEINSRNVDENAFREELEKIEEFNHD